MAVAKKPEITSFYAIDINNDTFKLTGDYTRFIRNKSTAHCEMTIESYDGAYITHAFIGGRNVLSEGENNPSTLYVERDIEEFNPKDKDIVFLVGDSYGYGSVKKISLTNRMVEYNDVTLNTIRITRDTGDMEKVRMRFTGYFFDGCFDVAGKNKNTLTVKYRYCKVSEESTLGTKEWKSLFTQTTSSDKCTISGGLYYCIGEGIVLDDNFDYDSAYVVEVMVTDGAAGVVLSSASQIVEIPPAITLFDWGVGDFNFNIPIKYKNKHIFEHIYPIGSIYMSTVDEDPYFEGVSGIKWNRLGKEAILGRIVYVRERIS